MDWRKVAIKQLGRGATIWLLVVAERRDVGPNVGSTKSHYHGKIEAFCKEHDIELPDIEDGYNRLLRVQFPGPRDMGLQTVRKRKSDREYFKLTSTGLTLSKELSTDSEFRKWVKQQVGVEEEEEPEPWLPGGGPIEDAPIYIECVNGPFEDEEFTDEMIASFDCGRCGRKVRHRYEASFPDAYGQQVEVECPQCGTTWRHYQGIQQIPPEIP